MTEEQMKEQIQAAQDMLDAVGQQRDAANNQIVQLAAANRALQRQIEQLKASAAKESEEAPELDLVPPAESGRDLASIIN